MSGSATRTAAVTAATTKQHHQLIIIIIIIIKFNYSCIFACLFNGIMAIYKHRICKGTNKQQQQ